MGPRGAVAVRDRDETLVHCEIVALLHSKQVSVALAESLTATAEVSGERFWTRTQRYATLKHFQCFAQNGGHLAVSTYYFLTPPPLQNILDPLLCSLVTST